ncbi:lysophospholipid acyltransferase family protein [Flavobacteriaceae bacterium 14752]|uniref:lysophospholipid acyltransferase family protein n=1 Tax=Mesohalobacter salilacus TaxID=2491711 RepID=UPI000F63481B|nr:lipid A biosynthesis acyltransferase [Flavobacteriaceae bacterium 14752]
MQFILYILIYPAIWLISKLPFKLLYLFSDLLYLLIFKVFGYRRKVVQSNLELVFPEKSKKEISTITSKFYHHLCDMIMESLKSLTIKEKDIKARYKFTNIELILDLEQKQKSIVLMCAHYGSWEWIFILQRYVNHKGYAVYKKIGNKYFDRLVRRIRAKYDTHLITNKETVDVLSKSQANNELSISGFVSDQSPKPWKALHWNTFMGINVPMHTGAEYLAKKLDMAVVFFKVNRIKRGYYETTFETLAEQPNQFNDYAITDLFFKKVEDQIRNAPEFYLWTHKRWKHRDKVPKEFSVAL